MADLLECLIQISALGEMLDRLTRLPRTATGSVDWKQLADAERRYAVAIGLGATGGPGISAAAGAKTVGREAFIAQRLANLAVLSGCTAAQLGQPVEWPGRRSTTVADLVAIMLANDTELLGELRSVSPSPQSPTPWPPAVT